MGPRKKAKQDHLPASQSTSALPESAQSSSPPYSRSEHAPSAEDLRSPPSQIVGREATAPGGQSQEQAKLAGQLENRRSWYSTWTTRTRPPEEIAREGSPVASRPHTPVSTLRKVIDPALSGSATRYFSGSLRGSLKGVPLATSMTKINATVKGVEEEEKDAGKQSEGSQHSTPKEIVDPPLPPEPSTAPDATPDTSRQNEPTKAPSSTGWLGGWWSRPDGYVEKVANGQENVDERSRVVEEAKQTPLPGVSPQDERVDPVDPATPPVTLNQASSGISKTTNTTQGEGDDASQPRSWFRIWSRAQNAEVEKANPPGTESGPQDASRDERIQTGDRGNDKSDQATAVRVQKGSDDKSKAKSTNEHAKTTGWAFWSREGSAQDARTTPGEAVHKQVGELAVADTPSQSCPEAAQFNEQEELAKTTAKLGANPEKKRRRAQDETYEARRSSSAMSSAKEDPPTKVTEAPLTPSKQPSKQVSTDQTKPNQVVPEFRSTYSVSTEPTLWQQVRQYFLGGEAEAPHLRIAPNPRRLKRAIAIGVHGFFPSPLFQKVLGPPTGTSIRFANTAAQAIKDWTSERGYECEIEKVALEGEGFISDRVDTLWKLMLNWVEQLRRADFILVACHSQGVPVSIMLVEKLLDFGCVAAGASIGVCAMAGVNLGPFAEYKTRMFGPSALELFDFADPNSSVSIRYQNALERILKKGVRVLYVGSLDDQLVSLESSTFSNVTHPYIYRACFVDGRIHSAEFITRLIGFTLKLRNLGLPDHGLIRELSPALAGSIYTGDGHSRLYDFSAIYQLAISHALETTTLTNNVPLAVKEYEGPPGTKEANPFFLPWAMRGVLEEELVRRELGDECQELIRLFDNWKPTSKGLKDVKFRLEVLRSKL